MDGRIDKRTDIWTQFDSIYFASTASHGKNKMKESNIDKI